MITSYEVGAVLKVVDEASPILQRIATAAREVEAAVLRAKEALSALSSTRFAGLSERLTAVNTKLAGIAEKSGASTAILTENFAKVDASLMASVDAARMLKVEIGEIAEASRGVGRMQIAGAAGGGSGGGGRGRAGFAARGAGGAHFGSPSIGKEGFQPGHIGLTSPVAMGAAALGYGVWLESEFEDQAARMVLTGQMNSDAPMVGTPQFDLLRSTMQRISGQTGYSPKDVGEAMLGVERQFGGLPFDQRVKTEETIAPYAAAEARMKETDFKTAFEALVGLTHMTGTYDVNKIPELMRQFSYTSMVTPTGIEPFGRALSYSMPMLHAGLDMDPSSIMFLTAMTQTAGITNTKSGTWLRSFFENAEPRIGESKSDLAHNEALQKMGLLDQTNHVTWQSKGLDGKTDWNKSIINLSEAINKFTQATDPAIRLGLIKQGFGERGGGEAGLMNLTEFIKQFPVIMDKMKNYQGGADAVDYLAKNSPQQQGRQLIADTQNALMDLGKTALPAVAQSIRDLDKGIKDSAAQIHAFVAAIQPAIAALGQLAGAISGAVAGLGGAVSGAMHAIGLGLSSPGYSGPHNSGSSYFNPHGDGPSLQPPTLGKQSMNTPGHVYLDGAKVGSIMWGRSGQFTRSAPSFDTHGSFVGPDYAMIG